MIASRLFALARAHGVNVVLTNLGMYSGFELRSEFDPSGPAIRVNSSLIRAMHADEADLFVARAIAHEFYHYLEHRATVDRSPRSTREQRAERFAQTLIASLA